MRARSALLRDTRGANLVEYLVIVGLIALVAMAGFRAFGRSVDDKATAQAACVDSLACSGTGTGADGNAIGDDLGSRSDQINRALDQGGDEGGGFWGWLGGQAKNFVKGGILGSFGGNTGWAGFSAKMIVGVIPIVGQIADARDTIAGVIGVVRNPASPLAWTDLGAAAIGWVPLFGDAAAQSIRGGKELMTAVPWIQRTYAGGRQAERGEPED
jgi:Flp pilus assembly pilin Flp